MADDADDRRRQIAERAYYRAERRGFAPGGEEEDWLEAERELEGTNGDNLQSGNRGS